MNTKNTRCTDLLDDGHQSKVLSRVLCIHLQFVTKSLQMTRFWLNNHHWNIWKNRLRKAASNFPARVTKMRSKINESEYVIKGFSMEKIILVSHPVPPLLYKLLKVHKEGNAMCGVSCPTSPSLPVPIAKFLGKLFRINVDFISQYSVKNSLTMVEIMEDSLRSYFFSFDPHISKTPTVQFLGEHLVIAHTSHEEITELCSKLKLIISKINLE